MEDITIVTSFYDIGRENWSFYSRKNSEYFECFKRLCKLKNKIVVFTQKKFKEEFDKIIETIKSDLIVFYDDDVINDFELISKIEKTQKIVNNMGYLYDGGKPPEYWNPRYVLVNFLKSKFCNIAIQNLKTIDNIVSWIDFGYVKNDNQIPKSKIWKYDFNEKIHLWNILKIPEVVDIPNIIQTNTVYIQGCHIVCLKDKWPLMLKLMENQFNSLICNNLIDDDQTLLLMSYLSSPENFNLHFETINSSDLDWFFIFQHYNQECDAKYKSHMELAK
jgi:protein YibB